jgi:hypothetical protein
MLSSPTPNAFEVLAKENKTCIKYMQPTYVILTHTHKSKMLRTFGKQGLITANLGIKFTYHLPRI